MRSRFRCSPLTMAIMVVATSMASAQDKAVRRAEDTLQGTKRPAGDAKPDWLWRPTPETGGDTCATALNLTPTIMCNGTWLMDSPIGMTTATSSGTAPASCFGGDPTQNDRWYTYTNSGLAPVQFIVSTFNLRNAGPPLGDSQVVVYNSCAGPGEIVCNDDINTAGNLLSDTCFFTIPGGSSVVIQIDGFNGDQSADAAFFMCRQSNTGAFVAGDSCADAIPLGTLSPSMVATRSTGHYTCPTSLSHYNELDPTDGTTVLNQPETCFSFTTTADGWIQAAATPASNNARIQVSPDGGTTWTVSNQCYANQTPVPPDNIYSSAAQHGMRVSAGQSYCLCVDSATAPITFANTNWDLEMYYWPLTTQQNINCARAEPLDFCLNPGPLPVVTRTNLSTAGAGNDAGVPPGSPCGTNFWDVCSGDGQDLNYSLTWTQGMVDCGCTGFQVAQTAPDIDPGGALVCDAAIQIGTSCPITPATCSATVDDEIEGVTETAQVTGLGQGQVGTLYSIQADQYMASACPDFDLTFSLLGCNPGCTICGTPNANLDLRKTRTSAASVPPAGTVTFDIVVENTNAGTLTGGTVTDVLSPCFDPIGVPFTPCPIGPGAPSITCTGPGCATALCTVGAGGLGFVYSNINLGPTDGLPGGSDEMTFSMAVVASATLGSCQNSVETNDPTDGVITAMDSVTISATPITDLDLSKTLTSTPAAPPGSTVSFDIVVENLGDAPLVNGILGDTIPACLNSIGVDGNPCPTGPGAPSVVCAGAGCVGAICTISNGGLGFVFSGFSLTATDGVPGGGDEITVSVDLIAGSTPGLCSNVAGTADPTDGTITSQADVTIGSSGCQLVEVLEVPPIVRMPPPWVYTTVCSLTDSRLDNTVLVGAVTAGGSIDTTDMVGSGAPGDLRLYQIDCGCANDIYVTENSVSGFVAVYTVP